MAGVTDDVLLVVVVEVSGDVDETLADEVHVDINEVADVIEAEAVDVDCVAETVVTSLETVEVRTETAVVVAIEVEDVK